MPRLSWKVGFWSVTTLSAVLICVPQPSFAADEVDASVEAATASPADGNKTAIAPSVTTEQALEQASFSEHLANPTGPCGRPDCPVCNPPPAPKPPAPILPWKGLYFDNDFSYKGKPDAPYFPGEELKNMPLFEDSGWQGVTLSYGGEVRHRFMDEDNRIRPAPRGQSNYNLWRWRQYLDLKFQDNFRVYVEGIDASIFGNELPPVGIDKNRWDIQNAFFDVKIAERDDKPVYFRAGRQELLFGAPSASSPGQQVISPLDWANTRRNFEGFRLISKGADFDFDAFAVRPVNTATGHGTVAKFDNHHDDADDSRWMSGMYSVYRGFKGHTIEPYYVWLETDAGRDVATLADGDRHTLGLRWTMTQPVDESLVFNSDTEGAYQFGKDNGRNVQAGFFTSKAGFNLPKMPWTPHLQAIYYYGSGDSSPTDGTNSTYNVLFPLGHAYWGIIDNLAGQNLNQIGLQGTVKPTSKLTCVSAFHWFSLVSASDRAYNVAGVPFGTAGAGGKLGEELDLIATYAFAPNFDVQAGYSWFWYGNYVSNSAGLPRDDATQFYLQTSIRY